MTKYLLWISLFLVVTPLFVWGVQNPRPFSGQGVLIVRPFNQGSTESFSLTLYREPGVGRIADHGVTELPLLSSHVEIPAGEYPLAVMGKKGNWMLVAYDDAGREGWVKVSRWWEYSLWEDFLKGRSAQLLSGLKTGSYFIHGDPAEASPRTGQLTEWEELKIIEVRGDWAMIITGSGLRGWLLWRDGDGRFMISVGEKIVPQKH